MLSNFSAGFDTQTAIHIGTCGWSYKDWAGGFYPPGLPAAEYLTFYAERYSVVEPGRGSPRATREIRVLVAHSNVRRTLPRYASIFPRLRVNPSCSK